MNALSVGSNKEPLLQYIPNENFLLIDDGPFIDEVRRPFMANAPYSNAVGGNYFVHGRR